LRWGFWMQALVVVVVAVVAILAITDVVDNWSDWVVLGVIVATTFAVAATVLNRQYPTRKRSYSRDSESKW
jgi:nicotinamide riboside transporter PnuC